MILLADYLKNSINLYLKHILNLIWSNKNGEKPLSSFNSCYISRFDKKALDNLGLKTITEAFNTVGKLLNVKPNTVKNMRDEFDPIHPNRRKGWYQRELRPSRVEVLNKYRDFNEIELTETIISILDGEYN